VSLSTDFSVVT